MAKPSSEVLTRGEWSRITEIQKAMDDQSYGTIVESVLHIECIPPTARYSSVFVATYETLKNPYEYFSGIGALRNLPEEQLKQRRAEIFKSVANSANRRPEKLQKELAIRTEHIRNHKYYVSEAEGVDVGLIKASAMWLKEFGEEFYSQSEAHYREFGSDFKWVGMEKAIVIAAPDKSQKRSHFVLVRYKDLNYEECMAQGHSCGAITRFFNALSTDARAATSEAAQLREKLTETHEAEHFCILDVSDDAYEWFYGHPMPPDYKLPSQ